MSVWGQLAFQEAIATYIELLNYFHDYIMYLLIIIIVFVTYVFMVIMFMEKVDKYTSDSHVLETVWTVVPIIILLFMAFPSLYLLYLMEDASSSRVSVKVVGHQWYWEYEYINSWFKHSFNSYIVRDFSENGMVGFHSLDVDNRLVLPTNTQLLFLVSSADVLHSWTVPSLGFKVDAIPGRLNNIQTLSIFSGVYFGQCREICGSNHRYMPIVLEFIPVSAFLNIVSQLS